MWEHTIKCQNKSNVIPDKLEHYQHHALKTHANRTQGWLLKYCELTPTHHGRFCFRFQVNCVIRWLTKHEWLMALQLMSQCHKDGFHMIVVIGILSGCFKQRHAVSIGKFLGHVRRYLNCTSQITFISHQNPGYIIGEQVLLAFFNPQWQTMKTGNVCHVVHKHDRVDVPIIVLHHALPESLLPGCIPELDLEKEKILLTHASNNVVLTLRQRSYGNDFSFRNSQIAWNILLLYFSRNKMGRA